MNKDPALAGLRTLYALLSLCGNKLEMASRTRSPQFAVRDQGLGWRTTCNVPRWSRIS